MLIVNKQPSEMSEDELIELLQEPLRDVIARDLEQKEERNRQEQIALARRNTLYMEGKQYLAPRMSADGRTWDWVPVDSVQKSNKKKHFANTFNIIYSDGVKFIAVVSQRPLNMQCVPDDPLVQEQVIQCKEGNAAIKYLSRQWQLQRKAAEIAYHIWSTSAVYLHTRYVTDKRRFGTIEVPQVDYREEELFPAGFHCSNCGEISDGTASLCPVCAMPVSPLSYQDAVTVEVPYENGTRTYSKGSVDLEILTALSVGHAFEARSVKEMDWLTYDSMEPKYRLQAMYGLDDEEGDYSERTDRLSALDAEEAKRDIESPMGVSSYDSTTDRWLHSRKWIRPEIYRAMPENLRNVLKQRFPDGARLSFAGRKLVKIDHECLDDYWAVIKTGTGPRITSAPLCQHIIPEQDAINNFFNMAEETLLRGIPKTFVDSTLWDEEVAKQNEALVGEVIRVRTKTGEVIKNMIGELPVARMNDQMIPYAGLMREYSRDTDGVVPAIFGGGEAAPTFRQEQQRKNQALMQFGPVFTNIQNGCVDAMKNGVKELARYGSGVERIPSKDPMVPSLTLTIANLSENGYEIEAVESDPQTIPEKQDRISSLTQENPAMASALGFDHPMNANQMHEIFGIEDLFVPGDAERNRAISVIQKLLMGAPVESFDQMTGAPAEHSSIPPDEFEQKNPVFFAQVYYAWCIGDAGVQLQETNPTGFANVQAHWREVDQIAQMQAAPPPGAPQAAPPEGDQQPQGGAPPPESTLPPLEQ